MLVAAPLNKVFVKMRFETRQSAKFYSASKRQVWSQSDIAVKVNFHSGIKGWIKFRSNT